jgi:hypothetical protein
VTDDFDDSPSRIRVTLMLADAAQVADSKLYILGGGLALIPPTPSPLAIAMKIDVPWDRANTLHDWKLELLDADGLPVLMGDRPVIVAGQFEVGRSDQVQEGTALPMPVAVNFSGLALPAGQRYVWRLAIDDGTEPDWQIGFAVAPAPAIDV